MASEALKPCPFCGAADDELGLTANPNPPPTDGEAEWGIQCYVCNVETPYYDTKAEVLAAWNRRARTTLDYIKGSNDVED